MTDPYLLAVDAPLGLFVRELRRSANMTQAALAAKMGTTQPAVARWESGRDEPRISTLRSIGRACGVDLRIVADDGVDRDQIRSQLDLTVEQRLAANRSVAMLRDLAGTPNG